MFPRIPVEWRDLEGNVTLEQLNDLLVGLHIPGIVFILVLMVVGVVGNILSIYVFTTRYESSTHRYFILWMAWIDLIACSVCKPLLLVSLIKPYMFPSEEICKIGRFLHVCLVVTSALIVVAIATERHRRICSPFTLELSSHRTFIICILATVFGSLMAIPAVLVYGDARVETGVRNISGWECFVVTEYDNTVFPQLYFLSQLVLAFICIVVLAILYSRTGITLMIHLKFRKQNTTYHNSKINKDIKAVKAADDEEKRPMDTLNVQNDVCHSISTRSDCIIITTPHNLVLTKPYVDVDATNDAAEPEPNENGVHNDVDNVNKPTKVRINVPETVPENVVVDNEDITINVPKIETEACVTNKDCVVVTKQENNCHNKVKRASTKHKIESNSDDDKSAGDGQSLATRQVTMMFFLITLVFVISFIPHLIVLLYVVIHEEVLEDMSPAMIVFYSIFLRFFVINNMANPIIYAFCDNRFRSECKKAVYDVFTCGRYRD